jgi:hypothetical protein
MVDEMASMALDQPQPEAETPWAAPWERRRHQRVATDLPCRLHGPWGELACRTENVSAGGVLLRFDDRALQVRGSVRDRTPQLAVARMAFGSHLEVLFVGRGVAAQARLARAVLPPDESWRLYLGCKFGNPLGPLHLQRIGLPTLLATPLEVPRPTTMPLPGPPGALSVRIRVEGSPCAPGLQGKLWNVGDHLLTVRVPRGDAAETVATLGGCSLGIEVEEGHDPIWAARGHLLSIRIVEGLPAIELQYLANRDPRALLGPRLAGAATA